MINFNFNKTLGTTTQAFQLQVEATIPKGSFVGIYGSSGAGKTTLLRLLSGLEKPDHGYLSVNDQPWIDTEKQIFRRPQERSIGYLFQDYALFPNMTIRQNLEYAAAPNQETARINELLQVTNLHDIPDKYPSALSGGQQQRAALARALVRAPELLLLDEPLSALDENRRKSLQDFLKTIHQDYQLTTILVSHNMAELARLCNLVIEMDKGQIKQIGSPDLLFKKQDMINLVDQKATVLSVNRKNGALILEVVVEGKKVRMRMDAKRYEGVKSGDEIVVGDR